MALQIGIRLLIIITLIVMINADITVQSLPALIRPNYPWNFSKMDNAPAFTIRPTESSFYHSTTPHYHLNNYQSTLNYDSIGFVGCKKSESIGLMNHVYTASESHPGYLWPGKPGGNSFQLPPRQSFVQLPQYWPPRDQNIDKQYQPPGYVSSVAKIDPPGGYKLWTSRY